MHTHAYPRLKNIQSGNGIDMVVTEPLRIVAGYDCSTIDIGMNAVDALM